MTTVHAERAEIKLAEIRRKLDHREWRERILAMMAEEVIAYRADDPEAVARRAVHDGLACLRPDIRGIGMVKGLTDYERDVVLTAIGAARDAVRHSHQDSETDHFAATIERVGHAAGHAALMRALRLRSRSAPWTYDPYLDRLDTERAGQIFHLVRRTIREIESAPPQSERQELCEAGSQLGHHG